MVGGGSWWELAIPAALVALFPVIEWVIHVGILHWRPRRVGRRHDRLAAGPQAPRAPRRPARHPAGVHPVAGAALAAAGVRRDRAARDADAGQRAVAAGVGLRRQVRLRVDPLPRAQRLPAAVARGTARCGATTGCTTTRTSTTGSPSPPPAPPTGCSAPTPTRPRCTTSPTVKALHATEGLPGLEPGRLLERRQLVADRERQLLEQGQRRGSRRPRQLVADPAGGRVRDRRTERLREVLAGQSRPMSSRVNRSSRFASIRTVARWSPNADRERRQVVEDVHRVRGVTAARCSASAAAPRASSTGMQPRRAYVAPAGSPNSGSQIGSFAQTGSSSWPYRTPRGGPRQHPRPGQRPDAVRDRTGHAVQRQVGPERRARSRCPPAR